jgi:hypothetical protein
MCAWPERWKLAQPDFDLHALSGSGQLISHTAASGHFAGPYPFHDAGRLID